MPEQQELDLRVSLDDQATAQLQQIRQALGQLGGQGQLGQLTSRINEFDKALGALTRQLLDVGKTAMDIAKVIGPMPVAFGALAYQMLRSSDATKAWALELQRAGNMARTAGIGIGEFKEIVASLKVVGLSAEGTGSLLQKFSRA